MNFNFLNFLKLFFGKKLMSVTKTYGIYSGIKLAYLYTFKRLASFNISTNSFNSKKGAISDILVNIASRLFSTNCLFVQ